MIGESFHRYRYIYIYMFDNANSKSSFNSISPRMASFEQLARLLAKRASGE